jgi:putative spermidine/putrescine transport system ATP-binding protein
VAVFNEGVIQQIDPVDRLYEAPVNRFVASFVGDNAVLDGTVLHSQDGMCQVQLKDGTRLSGVNVNQAQAGDTVQCSVRPERIAVLTEPQSPSNPATENALSATLSDVIYFGDHLRLRCQVPQQPEMSVKVPLNNAGHFEPGQTIHLSIPPTHLRMYR